MLFENYALVDLSHSLHQEIPTWDDSCGFQLSLGKDNDDIAIHTSSGTHIDAPSHFLQEDLTIDFVPLRQLVAPVHVIDVSAKATADYAISLTDIQSYEAAYGSIGKGNIVVGYTGWSRNWSDPRKYRNVDAKGQMHFPVFSQQAITYLIEKNIAAIGIDSFAPEPIRSSDISQYPIHNQLFKAGICIIENLAHLDRVPPQGAILVALPLKILKGGESPARVIAFIPKNTF